MMPFLCLINILLDIKYAIELSLFNYSKHKNFVSTVVIFATMSKDNWRRGYYSIGVNRSQPPTKFISISDIKFLLTGVECVI